MSHEAVSYFDTLADVLEQRGYNVSFIPQNEVAASEGMSSSEYSSQYYEDILSHEPELSLEDLTEKYDIPSARKFVFPQMNYDYPYSDPKNVDENNSAARYYPPSTGIPPSDFEPFIQWLHQCLDFFDQMFESGDGGMPLQYQGGEVIRLALEKVSDHHGYRSVWVGFSPISGYTGFFKNSASQWPSLENVDYNDLSEDEIKQASDFIERVREQKPNVKPEVSTDEPSEIKRIVTRLQNFNSPTAEGHSFKNRLKRRLRRSVRSAYAKRNYLSMEESANVVSDGDFVFYPIQYYFESRVPLRAPAFYEQAWLIEYLYRSIPTDHKFVTKDHPQQLGAQPKRSIDIMSTYSEALDPSFHSHDIIENASVVVTLNNTVGYEALVYGKPVVTLGRAFYEDYTYSVSNINNLDEVLQTAMKKGGPSWEEIVEFVHGLFEGSREGIWRDETRETVENIVDGIISTAEIQ